MEGGVAQNACTGPTDEDHFLYKDERKALIEGEINAQRDADKSLLTLSGGALAVSMTYLTGVVTPDQMLWPSCLVVSWLCLGTAIVCTTASFLLSAKAYEAHRAVLDDCYAKGCPNLWDVVRHEQQAKPWNGCVENLNWIAVISFVAGVVAMGIFLAANLTHRVSADERETEKAVLPVD